MKKIIFLCLAMLSINSVLIQTVMTDNTMVKMAVRIICLVIFSFFLLIKESTISSIRIFLLMLSIILLLLMKNPDQLTLIFCFISIQVLFLFREEDVIKMLLVSSVVAFLLIFIFLFLGITKNVLIDYRDRMNFGMASTSGNGGVPFFYNMVYGTFTLMIIYFSKYKKKYSKSVVLVALIMGTYFYMETDVRGGYNSLLLFIILTNILPRISRFRMVKFFTAIIPFLSIIIAFIISSLHVSKLANELLSQRPRIINSFLKNITIKDLLLSKSVKSMDSIGVVDNSYIHLLIGGGLIIFVVVLVLFYKCILNLYAEKMYLEISFLVSTCIYFNLESLLVRVENMFIIYFWYILFKYSKLSCKNEVRKEKKIRSFEYT